MIGAGVGRLVLVPVTRPADVPAQLGWLGPCNIGLSGGELSAVLRTWEDRFACVLTGLGPDTPLLEVGAPPSAPEVARRVARDHYAVCPDNIDQGIDDIDEYADTVVVAPTWAFWWD
jgi:hypothetical protein